MSLYTANLAAFLTISMARVPIKNLEELASQTVYKPLVKDGTNLYMLFKVNDFSSVNINCISRVSSSSGTSYFSAFSHPVHVTFPKCSSCLTSG